LVQVHQEFSCRKLCHTIAAFALFAAKTINVSRETRQQREGFLF
jgi:hypothetical protein